MTTAATGSSFPSLSTTTYHHDQLAGRRPQIKNDQISGALLRVNGFRSLPLT